MKFTGIVASMAVAGVASAAAIPVSTVDNTLNYVNTVLSNVEGLVGQTLSCVTGNVDLSTIHSDLVAVKAELVKIAPVSKRDGLTGVAGNAVGDVVNTAGSVVSPVAGPVLNTVGEVAPLKRDIVGNTVGDVVNTAGSVVSPVLDTAGSVASPVVSPVLNTVGSIAPVKRDLQVLNAAGAVVNTAELTVSQLLQGLESGSLQIPSLPIVSSLPIVGSN